jgi:hypothetical protein
MLKRWKIASYSGYRTLSGRTGSKRGKLNNINAGVIADDN